MKGEEGVRTSVLMIDDHADYRNGVGAMLAASPGIVCNMAASAEEALALPEASKPDVVLMDIRLPGADGIECTRRIKKRWPTTHVIMCTVHEDDDKIFRALRSGAVGYLLKRSTVEEIREAIDHVLQGGSPMSPAIARRVVGSFQVQAPDPADALTAREQDVLDWMVTGSRDKEIAEKLGVSVNTVRTHVRKIYEKLQVQGRVEAITRGQRG
jgi:DNA-binding NarL/FixJ family response regulator